MVVNFIEGIGRRANVFLLYAKSVSNLFLQILYWCMIAPFKGRFLNRKNTFEQMVLIGVRSLSIIFFIALFLGIVLAMQSAYQLMRLGATMYVAGLVAVSVTREIGPVLTALVVAGRSGSAIAAELGTMKVTEQIEALGSMALNPVRYLVVPRFLALLLMLPCLTIFSDLVSMFGGWLISVTSLKLGSALYIDMTIRFLTLKDIMTGIIKSGFFAVIIAVLSSQQGLTAKAGAEGVGKAATTAVVSSFIMIIVADCILTWVFYLSKM